MHTEHLLSIPTAPLSASALVVVIEEIGSCRVSWNVVGRVDVGHRSNGTGHSATMDLKEWLATRIKDREAVGSYCQNDNEELRFCAEGA
jgi:hypothetical protein